jgi:5-(carboxyamino)imidazole ribonucleotide mutase
MPPGIPVAAVGLDGGANAAMLAAQILALKDPALGERLIQRRRAMQEKIVADGHELGDI